MGTIKLNINPQINPTSLNIIMHKKKNVFDILEKESCKIFQKLQPFRKNHFLKRTFPDINQW